MWYYSYCWTGEIVQWGKVIATNPDDLSLIFKTHKVGRRESIPESYSWTSLLFLGFWVTVLGLHRPMVMI